MIRLDLHEKEGVAVIRPDVRTGLSAKDFADLAERIDSHLRDHGDLKGLVIAAKTFPGWEDFAAFAAHLKFIRDHHRKLARVALVSDSPLASAGPALAGHFVAAEIRHFPHDQLDAARAWAGADIPRAGRFRVLEGFAPNVAAVSAEGVISAADYEETLIPLLLEKIKAHGKVRVLYWCGPEFESYTAGAMWDDASFGMAHLGDFERLALVSDIGWIRQGVKLFAALMPAPVRLFHDAEIEEAKRWIAAA